MRTERLARSGSVSLVGSGFSALAALGLTVLIGNGIGATGTGFFFQAVGIFTITSHVLRLGTNSSVVKMISEQNAFRRRGEAWRTTLIAIVPVVFASGIAALVMTIFSEELASWLGSAGQGDSLSGSLRLMAPFIVMFTVLSVLFTVARMTRGILAFTLLQNVLLPLSRLGVVAIAVVLTLDGPETFRAWLIPIPFWLVVAALVLAPPFIADWRRRNESQESTGDAVRKFWGFSGSRAVGGSLEIALEWSDVLIVAALSSPTAAGIYAVATRTVRAGQLVDASMRVAVSPRISELLSRSALVEARELHTTVTRAIVLGNWPYYLLIATMGPAVLSMFGSEFITGDIVLVILAGAMMVLSGAGMLQSVLLQGGKSSWQMYNKAVALAVSVGLNLLLVPSWGIFGAALTWAVVILLDTLIAGWQVHRRMGVRLEPRKLVLAMTLPLSVFGVGGLALRLLIGPTLPVLLIGGLALSVLYLGVLWWLRGRLGIESLWQEIPLIGKYLRRRLPSSP